MSHPVTLLSIIPLLVAPATPGSPPLQYLPLLLVIPLIAFWAWMLRDMLRNEQLTDTARNTWLIAFIFLNVFAAVFYYVYEYRNRSR